jgi:hypothetical protein
MNNRFLVGGIIGGVAAFMLGYLIYGLAMSAMLNEHTMAGVNRPPEEMQWLWLVLGNLMVGFLGSYVLTKSNTAGFAKGAAVGAALGLLVSTAVDFTMYGTTNVMTLQGAFLDVIAFTIMMTIVCGIIGVYLGRGKV